MFLDCRVTCSKCYMILGIFFQIFSGIRDIGDPTSRASLVNALLVLRNAAELHTRRGYTFYFFVWESVLHIRQYLILVHFDHVIIR